MNASSEVDAAGITAISERGEQAETTASLEKVTDRNNTFLYLNVNDKTRGYISDETRCANFRSNEHILTDNHSFITSTKHLGLHKSFYLFVSGTFMS